MTSWSSVEWKSKRWFGLIENQKHCGFGVSENQKGVLGVDLRWRMVTWRAPGYKDQMKGRVLQDLIKTSIMNGCYYRCSCQLKEGKVILTKTLKTLSWYLTTTKFTECISAELRFHSVWVEIKSLRRSQKSTSHNS